MSLNIYKIRDMAVASGRAIYTIQQLANLTSKPKEIARVYASRLVKAGLARSLVRGKLSFSDDLHVIASQLLEPCYISLRSALSGTVPGMQVTKEIECVSTINSLDYAELGIKYRKISPAMLYGYRRHKSGASYVFMAEPEKAIIDGIYLNVFSEKTAREYAAYCGKEKLRKYAMMARGRASKKIKNILLDGKAGKIQKGDAHD